MHFHTDRTTLDKLNASLDGMRPPEVRGPQGERIDAGAELLDLKVTYLGGRDVLVIATHAEHDELAPDVETTARIPESEFVDNPDPMTWARAFASRFTTGRLDARGIVERLDGRDEVAGLMVGWFSNFAAAWDRRARDVEPDVVEELLEAIRLTQEYAQFPAVEGWSWYDAYRRHRPGDAERLRGEAERAAVARRRDPRPTSG